MVLAAISLNLQNAFLVTGIVPALRTYFNMKQEIKNQIKSCFQNRWTLRFHLKTGTNAKYNL